MRESALRGPAAPPAGPAIFNLQPFNLQPLAGEAFVPGGAAARRYAQAVFEMANQQETLDGWERDLKSLAEAFENPDIAAFFDNPQVPVAEKRDLVRRLLGDEGQQLTLNLAGLLIERQRFGMLPHLYRTYHELLLQRLGIALGEVTTAVALDDEELDAIRRRLGERLGKEIELRPVVDPDIIGGLIVRVGDQLIDGSVISQLRKLRDRLAARH